MVRQARELVALTLGLAGLLVAASSGLAQTPRGADGWYALGRQHLAARRFGPATQAFEEAVKLNPSAANFRSLGDAYLGLEDYENGARYYDLAVIQYRRIGQRETADALRFQADRFRPEFELYALSPAGPPRPAPKLAKFEPAAGLLLGVFVGPSGITPDGRFTVTNALGGPQAVYFRYHRLIEPGAARPDRPVFPTRFVEAAGKVGAAVHLALEPGMPLARVSEATVRPFAEAARAARVPIFVRFASEFNDSNNEWSRSPKLFVEKFRLVHDVLARIAPNAAMVWTPMATRLKVVDDYYPGRDYVDWVGITLYSTVFFNGDRDLSGEEVNPLSLLDDLYRKYARAHPFQVSEYAASHGTTATGGQDFSRFAATKLRMLYWGAYLRYPRLKNINWLDLDATGSAVDKVPERRSNYSLTSSRVVLGAYQALLKEPYFLKTLPRPGAAPALGLPGPFPAAVSGVVQGAAWVKAYEPYIERVEYRVDGRLLSSAAALPYRFSLDAAKLSRGPHRLKVTAFDARGKAVLERERRFSVR